MRNTDVYPVTKEEVAEYLGQLYKEKLADLAPGDMSCILLADAKAIVEKYGDDFFSG